MSTSFEPCLSVLPQDIVHAWELERATCAVITVGNINRTYWVEAETSLILQRLNPIFSPKVHEDIEAVTSHLAAQGLVTPRLRRTKTGALWVRDSEDGVWRVLTKIQGRVISSAATPHHCHEAGRLLGRFHRALSGLEYSFKNRRLGVHDTPAHARHLERALRHHQGHPAWPTVTKTGEEILSLLATSPNLTAFPERIVHGDPKLNNIVFSEQNQAICLIDLDTLGPMPLPAELGDAFRSWCNPFGEDEVDTEIALQLFEAAWSGYRDATEGFITPDEAQIIPAATETIALELAARFCADALEETYFAWNRAAFASASDHNLHRARSQLCLARSIRKQRDPMQKIVERANTKAT